MVVLMLGKNETNFYMNKFLCASVDSVKKRQATENTDLHRKEFVVIFFDFS